MSLSIWRLFERDFGLECCICVCVCVCVFVSERERDREKERERVCVCVSEIHGEYVCLSVCVWERESWCELVSDRDSVNESKRVCMVLKRVRLRVTIEWRNCLQMSVHVNGCDARMSNVFIRALKITIAKFVILGCHHILEYSGKWFFFNVII